MDYFDFQSFCETHILGIGDLCTEFSKIARDNYQRVDTVFSEKPTAEKHLEYVFPFSFFEDGIPVTRCFRLSLASDGIAARLKSIINSLESDRRKKEKKVNIDERISALPGTASDSDIGNLPLQKRSQAYLLGKMLLVRLFSDWLCSHSDYIGELGLTFKGNGTLSDLSDKNADIYLFGLIFYHQPIQSSVKPKTTQDYIDFLFPGKTSGKDRFAGFDHISRNTAENLRDDDYTQLITTLLRHPLYNYYLSRTENSAKGNAHREDLLSLLRHCLRYDDSADSKKGFFSVPVVEELILTKRNKVEELLSKEWFSSQCFFNFMGKTATEASYNHDKHIVPERYVLDLYNKEKEFHEQKNPGNNIRTERAQTPEKNLTEDLKERLLSFPWFNEFLAYENGCFRFKDKVSRLFFTAHYISQNQNTFSLFDTLLDLCDIDESMGDNLITVQNKFDSIILLSTMTLHLIGRNIANKFLTYLAEDQATQFGIKNRYKQIAAIAIISYGGLWESLYIDNKTRKLLFSASYGHTAYEFQYNQVDTLLEQPFFVNIIREQLNEIAKHPSTAQPLYFFLYHHDGLGRLCPAKSNIKNTFSEDEIKQCFEYRDITWKNSFADNEKRKAYLVFVKDLLKRAAVFLKSKYFIKKNSSTVTAAEMIQLYAVQSLLYSVFNYARLYPIDSLDTDELLTAAIFCDYYTRKFNALYDKIYGTCSTVTKEEKESLYLLCGPFRISCIRNFNKKITITDEMKQSYKDWLEHEQDRYKILLMRLLAYTNFYSENNYYAEDLPEVSSSDFLEYDNIDAWKIAADKHSGEKINPLNWYK